MGASSELFIKLSEQEYMDIPQDIRQAHLSHKVYNQSVHDFQELMQDELYASLYKQKKAITAELDQRQFQLRENKRNNK